MEKEQDLFTKWSERLDESNRLLESRSSDWDSFLRFYRQDLREEESPKGDTVWLNLWFGTSRIILPSIYFRNPDILVEARHKTNTVEVASAKVKERLLNYQLEEIDFENEMRRVIFDALYAYGVMKFGFAPAVESKKKRVRELTEMTFEDLFEESNEEQRLDDRISSDLPFAIRVSPRYFRIDPLATTLQDARWVAHLILKPYEQVKNSKRYPKNLVSGIEGTHRLSEERYLDEVDNPPSFFSSIMRKKEAADLVLLYEIWDRENDQLLVMDSWHDQKNDRKFLRKEDNPYKIEGFPFELLIFNPDPDSPLGVSDAKTWENPMSAINFINSMHYNHIKRFTRKYITRKGVLDVAAESKLTAPYDGVIVEVDDSNPSNAVVPLTDAPMTPDAYALRDILVNSIAQLTGVTEQRRGVVEKAKTATEASLIEQQARIRDSDRLYIVSKFVEKAAKKILQLDRQYVTAEYVAFVGSPEEAMFWRNETQQILQAEVDVKVRVGSSAYISREIRTKQLLDFLNLSGQLIDPMTGQPIINVRELIRRIADSMDLDDYESLLTQPMMAGPIPALPNTPSPAGPPGGSAMMQAPARRTGAPNLADMLSGVQNLGVRRSSPNPTSEVSS